MRRGRPSSLGPARHFCRGIRRGVAKITRPPGRAIDAGIRSVRPPAPSWDDVKRDDVKAMTKPRFTHLLLLALAIGLAGCSGGSNTGANTAANAAKEEGKRYPMQGEIKALDPALKTAMIAHGQIGDWMGAMTMEYPVKPDAEFQKLHVGDKIDAAVVVVSDTKYYVTDIKVASKK
jgi:Cu/Ag efflux protein CusF